MKCCLYLVSFCYFEANCTLCLAKANWTEIQRSAIRFLQVVRALHDTVQPLAMLDSKHVADLVGHSLQRNVSQKVVLMIGPQYSTFWLRRNISDGNLAGSKQKRARDGGSVIAIKYGVVALLGSNGSPECSGIASTVEVVIVPGKAENTHPYTHQNKTHS